MFRLPRWTLPVLSGIIWPTQETVVVGGSEVKTSSAMRHSTSCSRLLVPLLILVPRLVSARAQSPWTDFADLAKQLEPIEPTPMGEGHLGQLESGSSVQVRFPVPKTKPLGYRVCLGNVVAYTGKGSSYQLLIRRDGEEGDLVYEGPVIPGGDDWNASNREPIDLFDKLTDADYRLGYVDLFLSAKVTGDGWTLYRHSPQRGGLWAQVVEATEEVRQALQEAEEMRKRGIAVLPMPQSLHLLDRTLPLSASSRIVLVGKPTAADRFAAQDLADQLNERTKRRLKIVETTSAKPGDVVLRRTSSSELAKSQPGHRPAFPPDCHWDQAYSLTVTDRAAVTAVGEPGLFYGAQTVAQLVSTKPEIPRCQVNDWPAYPLRGLQWDVARGQTVKADFWKYALRELGRCKLNAVMIYGEDDYRLRRYPFLGREDTFTPEKVSELSAFAEKYHVQLIPQFEALGHAGAVLGHEELKDLREAGGSWVFCTSSPKTWEFLDNVFGELAEQFPNSRYFHVGGDEFEDGFAKCEQCQARVKEIGLGGLYAEHMNKLNAIVKKHGRAMLFWPSHAASTPELSYLTLNNRDKMERDCIPTEWIYHGPPSYPEIKQYQDAGFKDVWTSPAVVCYSIIYPDYPTTYRGIRGFLRAGKERGVKGTCTTTWEWMHGALFENSWLGLLYAAECGWSLGKSSSSDFNRRFAHHWLGLTSADSADCIADTIAEPWPSAGPGAICRNGTLMRDLFWCEPKRVRREFAMKKGLGPESSQAIVVAAEAALERLSTIRAEANRNKRMLEATDSAFRMYRHAGGKLSVINEATQAYQQASGAGPEKIGATMATISQRLAELSGECDSFAEAYGRAAKECGAYQGDVDRLLKLKESYLTLAKEAADLGGQVKAGKVDRLPPGSQFGFDCGTYVKIGSWRPDQMNEARCELRLDITQHVKAAGPLTVEWEYTAGAHGVSLLSTTLLADGKPVATDTHAGWTGAGSHGNVYVLDLREHDPKGKYEIVGAMKSAGGANSYGDVWLAVGERK